MSHTTNHTPPTGDTAYKGKVKFYRDRRCFLSILAGIVVFFITANLFLAFVSYVISGLYWDWLFFTNEGHKDSEQAPESYVTSRGITPQQMDEFNTFMIKVRRIAFALSISAAASCFIFFKDLDYQVIFVTTYIGINFGTMIIAHYNGRIMWPYRSQGAKKDESGLFSSMPVDRIFFDPNSPNPTVNPFWNNVIKPRNNHD